MRDTSHPTRPRRRIPAAVVVVGGLLVLGVLIEVGRAMLGG